MPNVLDGANKQGLIVFGGERSDNYGMVVSAPPSFERARRKQTIFSVPGRSGKKKRGNDAHIFPHIVMPTLINNIVLGLYVNTLWVSILYDSKNYDGWFTYRLPEYAVLVPLNFVFLPILLEISPRIRKYVGGGANA